MPLTDKTFCTSAKVPYGVGVQLHCKPLWEAAWAGWPLVTGPRI